VLIRRSRLATCTQPDKQLQRLRGKGFYFRLATWHAGEVAQRSNGCSQALFFLKKGLMIGGSLRQGSSVEDHSPLTDSEADLMEGLDIFKKRHTLCLWRKPQMIERDDMRHLRLLEYQQRRLGEFARTAIAEAPFGMA